jgi:hypothetical protein
MSKEIEVNRVIVLSDCQIDLLLRATCILKEHNYIIDYQDMEFYDYSREEYEKALDGLRNQILSE